MEATLASEEMRRSLAAPPGVTMGIERHTDAGLLTVLIQDTVSALQVPVCAPACQRADPRQRN